MECSHALLHKVQQQYTDNSLRYIPPDQASTRNSELHAEKKSKQMVVDPITGNVQLKSADSAVRASLGTDLLLKEALTRRALAYDQANLIDYHIHMDWVNKMFRHLRQEVQEDYRPATHKQLLAADREMFIKMAAECRTGIRPDVTGTRPLDIAMTKLAEHVDVLTFLKPLPASTPSSSHQALPPTVQTTTPRSKGKTKGSGKSKGPPEGTVARTADGKNICFAFNSPVGCPYAKVGKRCMKGFHLCGRAGCHAKHPAFECPKAVDKTA